MQQKSPIHEVSPYYHIKKIFIDCRSRLNNYLWNHTLMRLTIWAWNPTWDHAPPLEIILELDEYEHKPLPTCNKDDYEILKYKVLPLTRARDFLKIITSFAGLIEPFSNPDLSFYYTLTRRCPWKYWNIESEKHTLQERTLSHGFRGRSTPCVCAFEPFPTRKPVFFLHLPSQNSPPWGLASLPLQIIWY